MALCIFCFMVYAGRDLHVHRGVHQTCMEHKKKEKGEFEKRGYVYVVSKDERGEMRGKELERKREREGEHRR